MNRDYFQTEKRRRNQQSKPLPPSRPRRTLNRAPLDILRHPTSVEVTRLGFDFLTIDETLPGPSVEAQKPVDALETLSRRFVTPDAVLDDVLRIFRVGRSIVRGIAFPLAVGAAGSGLQFDFERAGRHVLCWWMVVLQHPEGFLSFCDCGAVPDHFKVARRTLAERRAREIARVQFGCRRHFGRCCVQVVLEIDQSVGH